MPKATEVTPQTSPAPSVEKFPIEQGDNFLLEDNLGKNVYKISFDESQHKVIHACRVHTQNEHASPVHIGEQVIVLDVRRNQIALDDAKKGYLEATISSVNFLITKNKLMTKKFHVAR